MTFLTTLDVRDEVSVSGVNRGPLECDGQKQLGKRRSHSACDCSGEEFAIDSLWITGSERNMQSGNYISLFNCAKVAICGPSHAMSSTCHRSEIGFFVEADAFHS